jgi:hypothetical protein
MNVSSTPLRPVLFAGTDVSKPVAEISTAYVSLMGDYRRRLHLFHAQAY